MSSKILIIDHNDSFTYNLVQSLEEAGAATVMVKTYNALDNTTLDLADGIVLSPGPGLPKDYPETFAVLKKYEAVKPILGVCLGFQIMVKNYGGRLYNLPYVKHGKSEKIYLQKETFLFTGISFPFTVGLYHSWAMNPTPKMPELEITAALADGTPMALQHKVFPICAVQFHPESYITTQGITLFKNWLQLVDKSMELNQSSFHSK